MLCIICMSSTSLKKIELFVLHNNRSVACHSVSRGLFKHRWAYFNSLKLRFFKHYFAHVFYTSCFESDLKERAFLKNQILIFLLHTPPHKLVGWYTLYELAMLHHGKSSCAAFGLEQQVKRHSSVCAILYLCRLTDKRLQYNEAY